MRRYRFTRPPSALRRARLDNVAIVPASLLPFKDQWQAIANGLPDGDVLLIVPPAMRPQRGMLERMAAGMRERGKHVTTLPVERFAGSVKGGPAWPNAPIPSRHRLPWDNRAATPRKGVNDDGG